MTVTAWMLYARQEGQALAIISRWNRYTGAFNNCCKTRKPVERFDLPQARAECKASTIFRGNRESAVKLKMAMRVDCASNMRPGVNVQDSVCVSRAGERGRDGGPLQRYKQAVRPQRRI
jgi:hypothetical protein